MTDSEQNKDFEIIFDLKDNLELEQILKNYKIISIKKETYTSDNGNFSDIYGDIKYQNKIIHFFIKGDSIERSIQILQEIGFEIKFINNLSHPLDENKIKSLIYQTKQNPTNTTVQPSNTSIDETKNIIEQSINYAEEELNKQSNRQSPITKQIDENIGELRKLRLSKNHDKINETLRDLYENIQALQIENLKNTESRNIFPGSINTNKTISQNLYIYNKIDKLKALGLKINTKEKIIHYLGYKMLIIKLLSNDILHDIQNFTKQEQETQKLLYNICIGIIITSIIISLIHNYIDTLTRLDQILGYPLLAGGILRLSTFLSKYINIQDNYIKILSIVCIFVFSIYISKRFLIL